MGAPVKTPDLAVVDYFPLGAFSYCTITTTPGDKDNDQIDFGVYGNPGFLSGYKIYAAYLILKYGEIRDSSGSENRLSGDQYITIRKTGGGTPVNAIKLPGDTFRVPASSQNPGGEIHGNIDIKSVLTGPAEYYIRWSSAVSVGNNLEINWYQLILRVIYVRG